MTARAHPAVAPRRGGKTRDMRSLPAWLLAGLAAVVVLAVGAWALVAFIGDESPGEDEDVTVEALIEEPRQYLGLDDVTVSGEVQQVYPRAFTIGAEIQDGQVLVIPPDDAAPPVRGAVVEVIGEVRRIRPPGSAVAEDTIAVDSTLVESLGGGIGIAARSIGPVD